MIIWVGLQFCSPKKPVISYAYATKYQSCYFVLWQEGWVVNSAFFDPKWSISGVLGAQRVKCQYRHKFYTGVELFLWSKVLCALIWNFALPPISPPLHSVVEVSKQNLHWTFDPINTSTPVHNFQHFEPKFFLFYIKVFFCLMAPPCVLPMYHVVLHSS